VRAVVSDLSTAMLLQPTAIESGGCRRPWEAG
jgi:hypothetical protein